MRHEALKRAAFLACTICCGICCPRSAGAGVSGYLELSESLASATTRRPGVAETKSSSDNFLQRYSLNLTRAFYPAVNFNGGIVLQRNLSHSDSDGVSSSGSSQQFSPNATLTLGNRFLSSSLGYVRSETSNSGSEITDIVQSYSGRVGVRPEGLPPLDVMFTRTESFTSDRAARDVTTDSLSFSTNYRPLSSLNLSYNGSLIDSEDRIGGLQIQTVTNTASGSYGTRFFGDRVNLYSNANVSRTTTTLGSVAEGGEISQVVVPSRAFFAGADDPAFVPVVGDGRGSQAPPVTTWTDFSGSLLNGDRADALAAINLGVPAVVGGDPRLRNLGIFLTEGSSVNTIRVYVDQNLPQVLSSQIQWSVYTSDAETPDTAQSWTFRQNATSVTFEAVDPLTGVSAPYFEIRFATLGNRWVKVVTSPLPQQSAATLNALTPEQRAGVNRILVTELEARLRIPAAQIADRKTASTTGLVNLGGRVTLLSDPSFLALSYDAKGSYNFGNTDTSSDYAIRFSNGLSALRTFGPLVSSTGRLGYSINRASGRPDSSSLNLSLSVDAHPLPTLSHNLTYSGNRQQSGGDSTTSHSIYLTNSARLYQGLSALLSGGLSLSSRTEGDSQSAVVNFGLNMVPHETLSLNLSYMESRSRQSGGERPKSSSTTRSGSLSASYAPLPVLYLFGAVGVSQSEQQPTGVTQNYGVSYSPFLDGTLDFSVSYNASLSNLGDQRTETISPSLRWTIRSGWWLDVTYSYQVASSSIEDVTSNAFSSTLRASF